MSSPKTNVKSATSVGGKKKSKSSDQRTRQTRSQEKSSKNLFRTEQIKLFDFSTTFKRSADLRKSEDTPNTGQSPVSHQASNNLSRSASKHKFGLRSASSVSSGQKRPVRLQQALDQTKQSADFKPVLKEKPKGPVAKERKQLDKTLNSQVSHLGSSQLSLLRHALFKESAENSPGFEGQHQERVPEHRQEAVHEDGFLTFNEEKRNSSGILGKKQVGNKKKSTKPAPSQNKSET